MRNPASARRVIARRWRRLGGAALLLLAAPAAALEVTILEPSSLEPIFGAVEVVAQVYTGDHTEEGAEPEPLWLELIVDGVVLERRTAPPWRWRIDVGQQNRPHRLQVRAYAGDQIATASIETPAIRVDDEVAVELQQLYVTATGRDGRRVPGLEAGDFRVFDDGQEQALSTFAGGDVAITAALLIDSSESMRGERLAAAVGGARAFLAGLKSGDEASLTLFADRVLEETPFTGDTQALGQALDRAEAAGETVINDHVYVALKRLDARQGRRVVVLFTDGADLDSVLDIEDVAWKARRSQALIYWLRLDDGGSAYRSFSTAWRNAEGNRRQVEGLERLVERSGGRIEHIADTASIGAAFAGIIAELREQYVLGYQPESPRNDGSWREVEVKSSRAGIRLRARDGYVDE